MEWFRRGRFLLDAVGSSVGHVKDSLRLAALATVAIPGLNVVAARATQRETSDFLYGGALDAEGNSWVIQEPRHAAAALAMDAEGAFLDQLNKLSRKDALPFATVQVAGSTSTGADGQWTAIVFPALEGHELDFRELTPGPGVTRSLARALAAIHELPLGLITDAGLPIYTPETYRQRRLAELDDAAHTGKVPANLLSRWEHALEDVSLWRFAPAVVHGDMAPENVLVDHRAVSAVLNWASVHVGDPAEDLAWLYAGAPEESLDTLEEGYSIGRHEQPDPHLADRALLYSELALARWLMHGVRLHSEQIVADATDMLTDLSQQVRATAPVIDLGPSTEVRVSASVPSADPPQSTSSAEAAHAAAPAEDWTVSGSLSEPRSGTPAPNDAPTAPTTSTAL